METEIKNPGKIETILQDCESAIANGQYVQANSPINNYRSEIISPFIKYMQKGSKLFIKLNACKK